MPAVVDGPMIAGEICVSTGNGTGIRCDGSDASSIITGGAIWAPGQPPQAVPADGNIAVPVFADGPMLVGAICTATGNGAGIKCDGPAQTVHNLIVSADIFNYNVATEIGNPVDPVNVTLTINMGITIGSNSEGSSALSTGDLPAGSTIKIVNNGKIQGKGGKGGYGLYTSSVKQGHKGGDALETNIAMTIDNRNGQIWSGGGGGGGGGNVANVAGGAGGGGGAGSSPGEGGGDPGLFRGYVGTELNGGARHSSYMGASPYWNEVCPSGAGGGPGEPGESGLYSGTCTYVSGPGTGGAAGYAVITNGNIITWLGGSTSPNLLGSVN